MNDFDLPETRYALSGDVNIAYQVMGAGPVDLIMVPGFVSHVEFTHELPGYTAFLRRLSTFARVVTFDKRGQGLSDRISGAPSLEQRMDDVRAVMDDIGSARAVVMGFSEGSAMSAMFAATYPERVMQLILFGGFALAPASRPDELERRIAGIVKSWGSGEVGKTVIPSQAANGNAVAQFAKLERLSASPGAVRALMFLNAQIDVRSILRQYVFPHSYCTGVSMCESPSRPAATWRHAFLTQNLLNIPSAITRSGLATPSHCSETSRSS